MVKKILSFIRSLFIHEPVRLAIVRRYADANGSYVGEMYMEGSLSGVAAYRMIGMSLDTLPLKAGDMADMTTWRLDTSNDFLALPMPPSTIRVGALDPKDNDRVRQMVDKLPRRNMTLVIQNRFIEHVLDKGKV
jgi:hypothetical protein